MDINRIWNCKHSTLLNIQLKRLSNLVVDAQIVRSIRVDRGSTAGIILDIQTSFL